MVIGQKKFRGRDNIIEKRVIEIIGERSKVRSFENGLKNFQEKEDYLLSSSGLDEKTYAIYSSKLKKGICEALKGSVKISEEDIEEGEFVVVVKNGSEEKMEDIEKKQDNKIACLTEEEEQNSKDKGDKGKNSNKKLLDGKEKDEQDTFFNQNQPTKKDDNSKGGSGGGSGWGSKTIGLIGLIGLIGVAGAKVIAK